MSIAQTPTDLARLWHHCLGHPPATVLSSISDFNLSTSALDKLNPCDICFKSKQTRLSFPVRSNKAGCLFELIHCDVWGPYTTSSLSGATYFLTIVDDFSRTVCVRLMRFKTEVERLFRDFLAMVECQFCQKVRRVRSDNGTEFLPLRSYFDSTGIIFETSCVATPQQNGRVERKHRHLLNVARSLLFTSTLPKSFWGESIYTAAFLINRTPTPLLQGKSPHELLYGQPPLYNELRVFGSLCFAAQTPKTKDKFASRSRRCVFIGYPQGKKGWLLYDLETKSQFASRDVVFYEDIFPFSNETEAGTSTSDSSLHRPTAIYDDPIQNADFSSSSLTLPVTEVRGSSEPQLQISDAIDTEPLQTENEPGPDHVSVPQTPETNNSLPVQALAPTEIPDPTENTETADTLHDLGTRQRRKLAYLQDYHCGSTRLEKDYPGSGFTHASSAIRYPIEHYVSCARFSDAHTGFLAAITAGTEPVTYKQASANEHWRQAMCAELDALNKNETWCLTPLPTGKKAIRSKWVYRIKYNSNGSIERYKARLFILENRQIEGVDFTETFAPVARMASVRVFLAVAAVKKWELHQMDVHNAFLHGDLHEEVYMTPPQGLPVVPKGYVCRLQKSLYGLRQAPRNWFSKLAHSLRIFGFNQSKADYSLFSYTKGQVQIHVLIYVDDLIVAGNDSVAISKFKGYLDTCFHMKDLGHLRYFLGIEIVRNDSGLFLSQRKYTLDILFEAGLLAAKPSEFPMEQQHRLAQTESSDYTDPEQYRRLIGRLIYLTITRPEISYFVQTLSQFMQTPKHDHWTAAIRLLHYLKASPGKGLLLSSDSQLQLNAYCDSD